MIALFRSRSKLIVAVSVALIGLGCSSDPDSGGADDSSYLGLAPPKDGFQIRSVGADIPVGADVEYCEVGRLPGKSTDTYYVKSFEFGNGVNSHHLIVSAATPGGPIEPKLQALGIGNRIECLSAQTAFGEVGFESVGGSQQPYASIEYPPGVGREYHGGQYVVFDYHYLNTTQETVKARSAVNFHLADAAAIEHIARGFAFTNLTIDTPAGQNGTFTAECHFDADLVLSGLARHTHRWGTDYSVWFAGGPHDGESIWTSRSWEHDVEYEFPEPLLMKAGEGLKFQCSYQNTTSRALRFGTSATDEMCILFGLVWEANAGQTLPSQDCDVNWVDAGGTGHPADEAGGFPMPSASEASICISGRTDTIDECAQCQCDACATPIIKCATDADCQTVLTCLGGCTGDACAQSCIDPHSSALGLLAQMRGCIEYRCPACSTASSGR